MTKRTRFIVATVFLSVLLTALLGEGLFRLFLHDYLQIPLDERNLTYQHDSRLGWFPIPNSTKSFVGSRPISAHHNSRGFRDREHGPKTKPRVLFLGDSYVWGYDVEQEERFTEKLQRMIPDWEVINMGISGYGTDQEYLLLRDQFAHYQPDIVFVVYTPTDSMDNSYNASYRGYHKPYFVRDGNVLRLKGIPVPKSINYYYARHRFLFRSYLIRALFKAMLGLTQPKPVQGLDPSKALLDEMRTFTESQQSRFVVGIAFDYQSERILQFCTETRMGYVKLQNPYIYPEGNHWTPEGHDFVAKRIFDFLQDTGLLRKVVAEKER